MSFGWQGSKVRLVPLERDKHFDNCVRWLNDPQVTQWLLIGDFPLTRVAEQDFFDRVCRPNDRDVAQAIETLAEKEEHIGICGIHDISFRHGTGSVGIIVGRQKLWGRGYGTDAIQVLTRYAFDVLGLRLLTAGVLADNIASLRVFAKNGYHEAGRIAARWWKRGAYRDDVLLIARRDEPVGPAPGCP